MPYLFTCPHCQARTEVEDTYSGQSGHCVVCAAAITLPDFAGNQGANEVGSKSRKRVPVVWIVTAGSLLVMIGAGLVAAIRYGGATADRLREGRVRLTSIRNLETIAAALNAYASDHGTYPPSIVRDAAGKPMHSWRALILPYIGEEELYLEIDFEKPWDAPENQSVTYGPSPSVFRHPTIQGWSRDANYYLITGPGTLFPNSGPLGPGDVTDGPHKTILAVEAASQSQSTLWLEPVDLDVVSIGGRINGSPGRDMGGVTNGGVCVATTDGDGHFLAESTPRLTVQSLITPRGDEPLPDDVLD
ncbi:MAG: DUF1559 domain-containing protein [Planctomycetota bacterium]